MVHGKEWKIDWQENIAMDDRHSSASLLQMRNAL
jgi:hypothetical protein